MTQNDHSAHDDMPSEQTGTIGRDPASGEQALETREDLLRIEQVSDLTGLTKRTLRYYEEIGLLPPPARTEGNYRLYTRQDVDHLLRIKRMRELLGASLAEIKEMVATEEQREDARSHYRQTSDPRERLRYLDDVERITRRQLELVQERMAGLEEMRASLQGRLQTYAERRQELRAHLSGDSVTSNMNGQR